MAEFGPIRSPDSAEFKAALKAQADAANPALSTWVEANAGSGKTRVLIDRVARLLLNRPDGRPGAPPNSILCVTYTKAAANEMLTRLFKRLGDWSICDDDKLRGELAQLEGRAPEDYPDEALKQARSLFARALETPGGLRIETIHAFCARVLRRFPLEAGVSPGFTEIEDKEANELWADILAARLEEAAELHPQELAILSRVAGGHGVGVALDALKFQRQAVTRFARSLGEREDMATRIRAAANAPDELPAEILEQAMGADFPSDDIRAAIAELDALPKRGVNDDKLRLGLIEVLGHADPAQRYATYLTTIAGSKHDWSGRSNPFTKAPPDNGVVVDLFTRKEGQAEGREVTRMKAVQSALAAAQACENTRALMTIGLPMVEAYEEAKRLRAALDFDDLIAFTSDLLTRSGAAQWVLYKLDGGLTHLLLDEAQDTSPEQWTVITQLVREFQDGLGQERAIEPRTQFVVGDPKQSIYSFQGADEQYFAAQKQDFMRREEPVAEAQGRAVNRPEMAMSFRSSPQILTFVDTVRAHVPLNDAATDPLPPVDADLVAHQARRANQPGRVDLWPVELALPGDASTNHWTTPTDHLAEDAPRRRLATHIARAVREMIDRGETIWREDSNGAWSRHAIRPEDVLILVQRRNELFDALIDSLKAQELRVAGADRLKLLDNIGVQDCLNLIRFALQPDDDLTLAEILRGPFCGLTDDDNHLFVLAHDRKPGISLWDRLQIIPGSVFDPARFLCSSALKNRNIPAFEFLNYTLNSRLEDGLTGWDRLIQRLGEPVRDPVRALLSRALGHDMGEPRSLQAFLAEIEGDDSEIKRELGEPNGAIRVMTVHGAKGLQAPVVILPDTTSATRKTGTSLFVSPDGTPIYSPSSGHDCAVTTQLRELKNQAGERESRRLLYVALTRASDRLIIAGSGNKQNSKRDGYDTSSWYRWCELAMTALVGDTDEPGTTRTYGAESPLRPGEEASRSVAPDLPEWARLRVPDAPVAARLSAPSRLLADKAPVSAPFGADRRAALQRGRLIHALLQNLPNLPLPVRADYARRFLQRAPDLSAADQMEMYEVTFQTLDHPDFAHIFAPGGRNEAAIVGTLPNGQMINGRVDRLIITPGRVEIIDYKTDRPAPKSADGVDLSYIVQMAAYRAVLRQLYPGNTHQVNCTLLYTDGPVLIPLPDALLSESLNRLPT